jgi:hypothetical protein
MPHPYFCAAARINVQAVNDVQSPAKGSKKARAPGKKEARFTPRQGRFLAFIHLYRKLHERGPAELDMVKFFRVSPPSAHQMVVELEESRLITRQPGVPRSARVAIPEGDVPPLEDAEGPPWRAVQESNSKGAKAPSGALSRTILESGGHSECPSVVPRNRTRDLVARVRHRHRASATSLLLSRQGDRLRLEAPNGTAPHAAIRPRQQITTQRRTSRTAARSTQRLRGTGSDERPGPSRLFENSARRDVCHSRPGSP